LKAIHNFATKGGSTIAIAPNGDIVSLARKKGDTATGTDLLKIAVNKGGKKLDSFGGNHDFYTRNGFEPISYVRFDENYAPKGWKKGVNDKEPVVFYKYTGKASKIKLETFMKETKESASYEEAKKKRDKSIKK